MTFKSALKKLFTFDKFMRIYLIMSSLLYVMGILKFLYLINSFVGFIQFLGLMLSTLIIIVLGLHLFQAICRLVGIDKIYANMKETIRNRNKKTNH